MDPKPLAAPNPQRQREARETLARLLGHPAAVYVLHYACQSFDQPGGRGSPRVTAIAARNVGTGETVTFSINTEIELARLAPVEALLRLDGLERSMLDRFFEFLRINRAMRFVHWKMRDATYGFAAIEHRYTVLGGTPLSIPESQKTDLARLLVDIYGTHYVSRPHF